MFAGWKTEDSLGVSWDRETSVTSLDQKEVEVQFAQGRIMREQSSAFVRDLETLQREVSNFRGFQERVEQVISELSAKHAQDLASAYAKINDARGDNSRVVADINAKLTQALTRLSACEGHGMAIDELRRSQSTHLSDIGAVRSNHVSELAKRDLHHTKLADHLDALEKAMSITAQKHVDWSKEAHMRLSSCEVHRTAISDLQSFQASFTARVEEIERRFVASADNQAHELVALKNSHTKFTNEVRAASVDQRLEFLERSIGTSAEKHAMELASMMTKMEQMHKKLDMGSSLGFTCGSSFADA